MSGKRMKALVYEGPKLMNIRELSIPDVRSDEVLIRVERVGICGSELSGYLGHNSLRKPPLVMGHEFSGIIASTGSDVRRFKSDDRVTVNPLLSCGQCRYCTTGSAQLCAERSLLGAHRSGAFAEYIAVPESNVYLLEDHVSFDNGALAEPFAVAVHVCRLLKLDPTDQLLIIGAGPIGLFILQAAQVYGLRNITIVDISPERLEIVKELGGTAITSLENVKAGSFDAAVDAVGMEVTRVQCMDYVRPGGSVVFSGLHQNESKLPVNVAIRNEIKMYGAFSNTPIDFETALQWITENRINLLPWTIHAPIEEGAACFDKLISGPGKVAKIMLTLR
ncbi:2-desacetyl-2-hydroxyethyl bacteriochlorophyllide A dehydrogenase [Paenibacillus castaneae]|uniref:galactitol-1-phosphate 5-dehydrogenase n=1 Tax=Paenibacillus castaneae TaxID=474957 RepID=UPI001FBA1008|nr:galactitol-1-phosphate 5-dehydrogenase [Paenibacillus castaneae]NIK78698.1 2-desacetyl-2-hydroxyethyl bacteriochlorophyllide A dehydrogenase [Paenibacillus castaneae]